MNKIKTVFVLGLLLNFLFSCNNSETNTVNGKSDSDSIIINNDSLAAQKVFYSLPAPHEVASILIEHPSASYISEYLNPIEKKDNYTTTKSKALNLGIYGTDLSYASMFEQNQTVINYMATSKMIAEELGILQVFNEEAIKKLEGNVNNKDEIINIISESFLDSDAYLIESGQYEVAAIILVGGWVEGMHIACKLSKKDLKTNPLLTSRILEQDQTLPLMISHLEQYQENEGIKEILGDLQKISAAYTKANSTANNEGFLTCSSKDFEHICNTIFEIREKYVK